MTENKFNTYDFIINDDDEVMLLIYAQSGVPTNPSLEVDAENNRAILHRATNNGIRIDDLPENITEILYDTDKILVCELSAEENEDDTKIKNAYEADINIA